MKKATDRPLKNLILATAVITLVSALAVISIAYFSLAVFAPSSLSDFFMDLGNDDLCFYYREKAYLKDKSADNLIKVTDAAINAANDEKTMEYALIELTLHEEKLINFKDEYLAYVSGSYALAAYRSGSKADALEKAVRFSGSYGDYNAIEQLISFSAGKSDIGFLKLIDNELTVFKTDGLSAQSAARLDKDRANLKILIEALEKS